MSKRLIAFILLCSITTHSVQAFDPSLILEWWGLHKKAAAQVKKSQLLLDNQDKNAQSIIELQTKHFQIQADYIAQLHKDNLEHQRKLAWHYMIAGVFYCCNTGWNRFA